MRKPNIHIIRWFVYNPVAANILMAGILLVGIVSAITIRKESLPKLAADTLSIEVPFRGGTPEDVERGVVLKIEEALEDVDGIERISATASESLARVEVEAEPDYPLNKLIDDVKIRVDGISTFPAEAERPVIRENEFVRTVMWLQLYGIDDEELLKENIRLIRDKLLAQPNIERAEYAGFREYEVSIEVDEDSLQAYGLTFAEVARAVQRNSIDLGAGTIRSPSGNISVRTRSQAYRLPDFADILVRSDPDGARVYLHQIAQIRDAFVDDEILHRFQGRRAIGLRISAPEDGNILRVGREVNETLAKIRADHLLSAGIKMATWQDGSRYVRDRLNLMRKNGLSGAVLVFICLALFLNLRLAFWVTAGIPVALAGAVWSMQLSMFDVSINVLSAFAFILVLGILVDDAVVIGESIYDEKATNPNPFDATLKGAAKVAIPTTFGVLTTIAAFYPLTFVEGRMGSAFTQIATVVIFCLCFSLVESKLILPSHLAHLHVGGEPRYPWTRFWRRIQSATQRGMEWFIQRVYGLLLKKAIAHYGIVLSFFISLLILTIGLIPSGIVRMQFFPSIDRDEIRASLQMEKSTSAERTHAVALELEAAAGRANENLVERMGLRQVPIRQIQVDSSRSSQARVTLGLAPTEQRKMKNQRIIQEWRKEFGYHAGVKSLSFRAMAGPSSSIDVGLRADHLDHLVQAADRVKEQLAQYDGVYDIKDNLAVGGQELELYIRPEAEALGLTRAELARQLRHAFYGFEAQRIQRGRDEVKVMVRYPRDIRRRLSTLDNMYVRTANADAVPLHVVADTTFEKGLTAIERKDRSRVVNVTADVDKTVTSEKIVLDDIRADFFPDLLADFSGLSVNLEGEAAERRASMTSLQRGFLLSLLLIYSLVAVSLRSYASPIIIMSVIPFGIIGAIIGHLLQGLPMSILSMFGVIALGGVVVNDSLLLVTVIQRFTEKGMALPEAIFKAGQSRFRAVFLTSLTTFAGLTPILLERSLQAQFLIPMATSLAFGILFATVITLFLIPALFCLAHDLHQRIRRLVKIVTPYTHSFEKIANLLF